MAAYDRPQATLEELRDALSLIIKNQEAIAKAVSEIVTIERKKGEPGPYAIYIQKPYGWRD